MENLRILSLEVSIWSQIYELNIPKFWDPGVESSGFARGSTLYSCAKLRASRLWYRDTRNNTSSPVIFPHFSLQLHYYTSLPLHPRAAASTSLVAFRAWTANWMSASVVLVLDMQSVHEDTVCHSNPQQPAGFENSTILKSQTRDVLEHSGILDPKIQGF